MGKGPHDGVNVNPTNCRHPRPRNRLAVSDNGERLKRPVEVGRRVLGPGVKRGRRQLVRVPGLKDLEVRRDLRLEREARKLRDEIAHLLQLLLGTGFDVARGRSRRRDRRRRP